MKYYLGVLVILLATLGVALIPMVLGCSMITTETRIEVDGGSRATVHVAPGPITSRAEYAGDIEAEARATVPINEALPLADTPIQ